MSKSESNKMEKVMIALDEVPMETKKMIFDLAQNMSEPEIISCFNQSGLDLFNKLNKVAIKLKKENEYKISGYTKLFEAAIKMDATLPANKFTLTILEFAPHIYNSDEESFLKMTIPDTKISVGNEFELIRSEAFKNLWLSLSNTDKENIKDGIISLTMYAHAYLYKSLLK